MTYFKVVTVNDQLATPTVQWQPAVKMVTLDIAEGEMEVVPNCELAKGHTHTNMQVGSEDVSTKLLAET